jgi:hypothetical protein
MGRALLFNSLRSYPGQVAFELLLTWGLPQGAPWGEFPWLQRSVEEDEAGVPV